MARHFVVAKFEVYGHEPADTERNQEALQSALQMAENQANYQLTAERKNIRVTLREVHLESTTRD
jgi:hypothetical protein